MLEESHLLIVSIYIYWSNMPAGRPTKYKKEFCKKLVQHLSKGYSFESFAGTIDVCTDTIFRWVKEHPEFSEAKNAGTAKSRLVWEEMGIKGAQGGIRNFNASSWIFNMKNRFKWTDRQQIDANVKNELFIIRRQDGSEEIKCGIDSNEG